VSIIKLVEECLFVFMIVSWFVETYVDEKRGWNMVWSLCRCDAACAGARRQNEYLTQAHSNTRLLKHHPSNLVQEGVVEGAVNPIDTCVRE